MPDTTSYFINHEESFQREHCISEQVSIEILRRFDSGPPITARSGPWFGISRHGPTSTIAKSRLGWPFVDRSDRHRTPNTEHRTPNTESIEFRMARFGCQSYLTFH